MAVATPAMAQSRAEQLALELSKKKDVTRVKKGVRVRKFAEVISTPWRLRDVRDYSGYYASEPFTIELRVNADGSAIGSGHDQDGRFELRNARINDAVLTARKVYRDGRSKNFEAVFVRRQDRSEPDATFNVYYGLGYIGDLPPESGSEGLNRFFLSRR
jgi:hypothetical protein